MSSGGQDSNDKNGIKWAEVARFADPIEAEIVKALLEANGFHVKLLYESAAATLMLTTKAGYDNDIIFMVPEDELEKAVELIESKPAEGIEEPDD